MPLATAMTVTCSPLSSDLSFLSVDIDVDVFDCNPPPSPSTCSSSVSSDDDSDGEDDDERNFRVAPHWQAHRHLFESHGYHLDTCKDVRQFYLRYWETRNIQQNIQSCAGYKSACREDKDDNELCRDEGLVSPLPAGTTSFLLPLSVDSRSAIAGLLAVIPVLWSPVHNTPPRDYGSEN